MSNDQPPPARKTLKRRSLKRVSLVTDPDAHADASEGGAPLQPARLQPAELRRGSLRTGKLRTVTPLPPEEADTPRVASPEQLEPWPGPPWPHPDDVRLRIVVDAATTAYQRGEVSAEGAILHAAVHGWYEGHLDSSEA